MKKDKQEHPEVKEIKNICRVTPGAKSTKNVCNVLQQKKNKTAIDKKK